MPDRGMTSAQQSEIGARMAVLNSVQSDLVHDWWREQRLPKPDKLNHDQAQLVLRVLEEASTWRET